MSHTSADDLILSVETATQAGSLAILNRNSTLAEWHGSAPFSHSNYLIVQIEQLLRRAGIELKQLTMLSAVAGPGGFTGLRVGLSTFKALSTALEIPLITIPTLAATAAACESPDKSICAVLNAGRDDFFYQHFSRADNNLQDLNELAAAKLVEILDRFDSSAEFLIAAPLEAQPFVRQALENRIQNAQTRVEPIANIAVGAGRIALKIINYDFPQSANLFYGRLAVAVKKNTVRI